jgi:hypothetical protein
LQRSNHSGEGGTFGQRARIGYLCPSVFEMITYDFYRIAPAGVGMLGVTCMIDGWASEAYKDCLEPPAFEKQLKVSVAFSDLFEVF